MAVDYLHRVIVSGPTEHVRSFRRDMHREHSRTVGGETWAEIVPFSFAALYELAPAVRRVEAEVPYDPYDLSVWPVRRITPRRAEVRYQFHTRNLELPGLLRPLSRALPSLTFTLATLCFDDSTVSGYRLTRGIEQHWHPPDPESTWQRARKKFHLSDDDVYMDDRAEHWVEEERMHEALSHWTAPRHSRNARRTGRRKWWNQRRLRDLVSERELAMVEIADAQDRQRKRKARRQPGTKKIDDD